MKSKIDIINEFRKEFMGKHYKPMTEKEWKELTKQCLLHTIEIMVDGELVALMLAHRINNLTRKPLILDDAIVRKDYRGKGIGLELYKIFIKLGENLGANCVEGATRKDNKPTVHIYEKLGFQNRKHNLYRLWLR